MRSLFFKILLWFLGAMVLTIAAVVLTTALTFNAGEHKPPPPFGEMVRFQIREATQAWQTGGPEALAATLQRYQNSFAGTHILTDAHGRDLLTGKDYSELIRNSRRPPLPFSRPRVFARPTRDEQYWFLVILSRRETLFWFLRPWHVWILGLVALLSYALARHFSAPVRSLKATVDRFGKGDLSARVKIRRNDEVGELGDSFNRMADRIESLVTAQRRLLQDISHELRSPLARLNVAIELARSAPDPEPTLDRIQKEADRLNELVGELIDVTRGEGDPRHRRSEPVRFDRVVSEVAEDCEIEAQAVGARIDLPKPPPATVSGDPELLRRAVENVVRNAIRHAPEGTPVEVRLENSDGMARVTVRDHGPGVPDESLPMLFEPFYRVESDRGRSSGGVGLGLAIVRRAVELHRGTVGARNAHPGLLVEIAIPAAPPKSPAQPAAPQPAATTQS